MELNIANKKFKIIDILSNITIVNTSVCRKHKISNSHGERKIYLPGSIEEKYNFFDGFSNEINGFVWKENLLCYLQDAKKEYRNPTRSYRNKDEMKQEHKQLMNQISNMDDILPFKIKKAQVEHTGLYINQDSGRRIDRNWNLITDIALPDISRISIFKGDFEGKRFFYFKLSFGTTESSDEDKEELKVLEKIQNGRASEAEKEILIKSRIGQGKYRKKLLEEVCVCPFTKVDDERLLIASHIKPWKSSNNVEKKDPHNGFVFTPTYDKLFDRGYISFEDNKQLIISPWLSRYTCEMLNLDKGMILDKLPEIDSKRKRYLEYHRTYVLKKMEDL